MKSADKFLIGIVAGAMLLVAAAFVVVLVQPKPTYKPDDTPEGVAYDYLFALQQQDYDRAYTYLSPTLPGYPPSVDVLHRQVNQYSYIFGRDQARSTAEVQSANPSSANGDRVQVTVRERYFAGGGLFSSAQTFDNFTMQLARDAVSGAWKIVDSDRYFAYCWNQKSGCPTD